MLPAAEANMWVTLMRLNNITAVWSGCRSHDQNGGEVCVCDLSFGVRPPAEKAKMDEMRQHRLSPDFWLTGDRGFAGVRWVDDCQS
jgi:hypothetical protein